MTGVNRACSPAWLIGRVTNAQTTPEAILRAADALFGERGFGATSTREIAAASGTNLALIHYHFRGKEGLYRAVIDAHYARLGEALARALAVEGTPRERVHRVADSYLAFLADHRGFCMMVQREATDPERGAYIRERMRPMFREAERLVHEAFPASRAGALTAAELMVSVFGVMVSHVTYAKLLTELKGGAMPIDAVRTHVHAMLDVLLDRLEADRGTGGLR